MQNNFERILIVSRLSQSGTLLTWSPRDEFIINAENPKENVIKTVLNRYNLPFFNLTKFVFERLRLMLV